MEWNGMNLTSGEGKSSDVLYVLGESCKNIIQVYTDLSFIQDGTIVVAT
jgi:hypothetical protein